MLLPARAVTAQDGNGRAQWEKPINISRSPDKASSDPFVLADPSGQVHLFWAEKTTDDAALVPNTIMYAVWNGISWSEPIDIFFQPLGYTIHTLVPQGILDKQGNIHLVWMAESNFPNYELYYSSAPASEAGIARSWKTPPDALASDLTGTNYSIDIEQDGEGRIHIVYARVRQGQTPPEPRAVSYLRSDDHGTTWTKPIDLFTIPDLERGASNTRILTEDPDKVYVTWTEWDLTGNGQLLYFVRSLDGGDSWDDPVLLARRVGNDYERDWGNLVLLGENHVASVWEGGFRAYRQAMYSEDAGATWSKPIDILPGLIGENGFALFAEDSLDRTHLFVAQRIREGNPQNLVGGLGLWHSIWDGGSSQWTRPVLSGGQYDMVNPSVAVINGNEVVAAWTSNTHHEIMVMNGELLDTPQSEPQLWPAPTAVKTPTPTPTPLPVSGEPESNNAQTAVTFNGSPPTTTTSPGTSLWMGLIPTLLIIVLVGFVQWYRQSRIT